MCNCNERANECGSGLMKKYRTYKKLYGVTDFINIKVCPYFCYIYYYYFIRFMHWGMAFVASK